MLKISNLTLGYDNKPLLNFNNFTIEKGDHCIISGASGSGKTTLLYTIAGLMPPISGSIVINNTDITALSEPACDIFRGKNIGLIFQTLHLVKSLSVLDNIMLAAYMAATPVQEKEAVKALDSLGILDKKDAFPAYLSQGQAQRVAIARALLLKPALILADEPTSSLDDKNTQTVITLIKQVAEETGATLLISTHDSRIKSYFNTVLHIGEAA